MQESTLSAICASLVDAAQDGHLVIPFEMFSNFDNFFEAEDNDYTLKTSGLKLDGEITDYPALLLSSIGVGTTVNIEIDFKEKDREELKTCLPEIISDLAHNKEWIAELKQINMEAIVPILFSSVD